LACAYMSPEEIAKSVEKVNLLTSRPYAINLFAPTQTPSAPIASPDQIESARAITKAYRAELQLPEPPLTSPFHPNFDDQFDIVLKLSPAVLSFVFGTLEAKHMEACRNRGILTMGAATTLEEARALEAAGVSYIVAQGTEAGGHRALFSTDDDEPGVSTEDLTKELLSNLKTPIIAAGGIMTGEDLAKFIKLGASAVQMGTAFLLAHEAATSKPYRELILHSERTPELTRAFSGRLARGLPNRFQDEMKAAPHGVLPFPIQNAFTRDLRKKSAEVGSPDFISAWAGLGVSKIRNGFSSVELLHQFEKEALATLKP
ncbi:MAG: nitronate monooxygenase, partial [Proteobacteria bacterium]